MHAHYYRTPDVLEGKRVLVLGIGNSATDIAVEASRTAAKTFLAMRRGAWIVPKYLAGKPTDELGGGVLSRIPPRIAVSLLQKRIKSAVGEPMDYGLPEPDHQLGEAHPTVSSDLLPRLGHGDIAVKPNIAEFPGGREVRFTDGSTEEIDVIVYCTGYRITFPFFDEQTFSAPDNQVPLYRYVFSPDQPGLYFVGLIQPLGAIMPLAEAQSEWIGDVLEGKTSLPSPAEMRREIARDREAMAKRFVSSKRHTIEVDFEPYKRLIKKERRRKP
jgi:cation diffusion facilitator CzcD-associated flavoprotein CzcO